MNSIVIDTILKYWVQAACALLVGAIGLLWRKVNENAKKQEKKEQAMEKALFNIVKVMLYQQCQNCLDNNYVTTSELEVLDGLNECYVSMNGNGTVHQMMKKVSTLKIKVEDPRWS